MRGSGGEFGLLLLPGFQSVVRDDWEERGTRVSTPQTGKGRPWPGQKVQLNYAWVSIFLEIRMINFQGLFAGIANRCLS